MCLSKENDISRKFCFSKIRKLPIDLHCQQNRLMLFIMCCSICGKRACPPPKKKIIQDCPYIVNTLHIAAIPTSRPSDHCPALLFESKLTWQKLYGLGIRAWVWIVRGCDNISLYAAVGVTIRRKSPVCTFAAVCALFLFESKHYRYRKKSIFPHTELLALAPNRRV